MIGRKVIEVRAVTSAESKDILKKKSKEEEEELGYEQRLTLDHLNKFSKVASKTTKKIVEELLKIGDKIKDEHAVKVADLLPQDEDDVRAIFAKERFALTKEEIKGILEVVSKYR